MHPERVICENCRLKGSLSNFLVEFSMLTWDGGGTSSYNEPSSHELARSQLFVRCKMVTKRTSLEMSHVELVTTIQELWNERTTCWVKALWLTVAVRVYVEVRRNSRRTRRCPSGISWLACEPACNEWMMSPECARHW